MQVMSELCLGRCVEPSDLSEPNVSSTSSQLALAPEISLLSFGPGTSSISAKFPFVGTASVLVRDSNPDDEPFRTNK
jgi:hypothetical protein